MSGTPKMLAKPYSYESWSFQTLRKYKCNHRQKRKEDFLRVISFTHTHTIWRENWDNGQWTKYLLLKKWKAQFGYPTPVWNSGMEHMWPHHWGKGYGDMLPQNEVKNTKQDAQGWHPQNHQWVRATYKHKCTYAHVPCTHRDIQTHNSKKSKLFQTVLFKLYKEQRRGSGEMA